MNCIVCSWRLEVSRYVLSWTEKQDKKYEEKGKRKNLSYLPEEEMMSR
jgi:hypothetical protein